MHNEGILGVPMESPTAQTTIVTETAQSASKAASEQTPPTTNQTDTSTPPHILHTKNLYPVVRHTVLVICVVVLVTVIVLLMLQNGKSIYDNGI